MHNREPRAVALCRLNTKQPRVATYRQEARQ